MSKVITHPHIDIVSSFQDDLKMLSALESWALLNLNRIDDPEFHKEEPTRADKWMLDVLKCRLAHHAIQTVEVIPDTYDGDE